MATNIVTALKNSSLFEGIADDALSGVIGCLQPKVCIYPKNSYIATEGDVFTGLGIIITGKATVIKENAAGARLVMTMLGSGDIFGEVIAFSKLGIWPVSVTAQSECLVMILSSNKIMGTCSNVCASHKQIISNMLLILSEKAMVLNRKVSYLSMKGMREKISNYLLEQHKLSSKKLITLNLNRNNLADFLNVSRTALSREMGRMRDEGMIEFYRASIKITDIEKLKKAIE